MRMIVFAAVGVLVATALLGFSLQSLGVVPGEKLTRGLGLPAALWPLAMPLFGGLIALAIGALNYRAIMRLWRTDAIEKADMRITLALFFGPVLALLMQVYVGFEHFDLTTRSRMMTALAMLQLLLFFAMGNYAATLRARSPGGFRTPWTMKSDLVWAKTHRFIGRGLFFASLAGAAALFFLAPRIVIFSHIVSVISIKIAAVIYSYAAWRTEVHQHVL